jgi:hypothetical protein
MPQTSTNFQENVVPWILLLYWTLNGEVVLNHEIFTNKAACESRVDAMRQVFEQMDHPDWAARCQASKQP